MKLYDNDSAPGSRRARIFLAEKGLTVPVEPFQVQAIDDASAVFSVSSPLERAPVLELDDGTLVTDSIAICRYFEALRPEPALFGRGGKEQALVEMWNRRIEGGLYGPAWAFFVRLNPGMWDFVDQVPKLGEMQKWRVKEFLALLDRELRDRLHIAGDHFSIADITALVAIELLERSELALGDELRNFWRWHVQAAARLSTRA
jgi:glutathione S-transferase